MITSLVLYSTYLKSDGVIMVTLGSTSLNEIMLSSPIPGLSSNKTVFDATYLLF